MYFEKRSFFFLLTSFLHKHASGHLDKRIDARTIFFIVCDAGVIIKLDIFLGQLNKQTKTKQTYWLWIYTLRLGLFVCFSSLMTS